MNYHAYGYTVAVTMGMAIWGVADLFMTGCYHCPNIRTYK